MALRGSTYYWLKPGGAANRGGVLPLTDVPISGQNRFSPDAVEPDARAVIHSYLDGLWPDAFPTGGSAGILCGLIYQGLVIRKNRLGDAMTAHGITNLLLGLWVVWKGAWNFW
jgi:hypothetical protein